MTGEDFTKSLLLMLAWRDGYSNGANAIIGCMLAVRNRVQAGWDDGIWIRVIYDMIRSGQELPLVGPDPRDPVIQTVMQAIDGIFDGSRPDRLVGGATHYFDSSKGGALPESFQRVSQIGTLVFCKE